MQIVSLQAVASQTVNALLGGQSCQLNIYQKSTATDWVVPHLFMDVYVSGTLIIGGVVCLNQCNIVRDAYLGFLGDFFFTDTYGTGEDPAYAGLGTQFTLIYVEPGEFFVG